MENVGFLTSNPTGTLSNGYFTLIFVVAILCFGAAFLFEHLMNKTGIDFGLFAILGIFLISGLAAIWLYKTTTVYYGDKSAEVVIGVTDKVRFSLTFFLFIVSIYSILFLLCKSIVTPRRLLFIYVILIGVCYFAIIYSLFAEIDQYEALFTTRTFNVDIKSLFWNTNMFSGTLLMGLSSCMICNIYKRRAISFISAIIFYFELLITCSVISVVIGTIVLFAYLIFEVIAAMKKNINRGLVLLTIFIASLTTLVCVIAVALDGKMGNFSYFVKHIYDEIFKINYSSFSGRTPIWEWSYSMIMADPIHMFFGYGFGISKAVIQSWSSLRDGTIASTHNGMVQILFNYGFVGVAIYALFLLGTFYSIIRLLRKHFRFAITFLFVEIIFLGYAWGESVIFFNSNAQGLLVGLLFYLPVLMRRKMIIHQEPIKGAMGATLSLRTLNNVLLVKLIAAIIISLIVALVPFLFFDNIQNSGRLYNIIVTLLICLGVCLVFMPYLVSLWHTETSLLSFIIRSLVNLFIIIFLLAGATGIYFLFYPVLSGTYRIYFPIVLAVVLLLDTTLYSILKKPSFKSFIAVFTSIFKTFLVAIVAALICIFIVLFAFKESIGFESGYLKYIVVFAFNVLVFYVFAILFMFKDIKAIIDYFELRNKNSICLAVLKDNMSEN